MPTVDLAACQVFVSVDDYASADAFEAMLARTGDLLRDARRRAGGGDVPCLAVFPENIGTFLPLALGARRARTAPTTPAAMARIAVGALPKLVAAARRHATLSPTGLLLLATSEDVFAIYRRAFARFAASHGAWVVAGSLLLPRNAHGDLAERFRPTGRQIYNSSFTFAPTGRLVGVARKVNLVPGLEDTLGLTPGAPEDLLAVDAPFGRFGSLVCYDAFAEPHTSKEPRFRRLLERYDAQGCAVIAQPAANPWPWDGPWVFSEPGETQLRREQWINEGLCAQLADPDLRTVRFGVTAHLLGRVFEHRFDGRSHVVERIGREVTVLAEAARADPEADAEEVVLARVSS